MLQQGPFKELCRESIDDAMMKTGELTHAGADMREKATSAFEDDDAGSIEKCKQLGVDLNSTWEMLYCGGSQPVLDSLETISKKTGIHLSIEKFDW
eukprot:NODE_19724_length_830_cov_4.974395.p2 GENE.NODE_19724_length_830_cov_4.974395~~NODE_19724_length_830_cov_4.974395.p2  ORF type:complete len:96 (-),score=26.20 NODE_19724_length_830_cov_4.974395:126-413(-)